VGKLFRPSGADLNFTFTRGLRRGLDPSCRFAAETPRKPKEGLRGAPGCTAIGYGKESLLLVDEVAAAVLLPAVFCAF